MKISFNTHTVTRADLYRLFDLVRELLDETPSDEEFTGVLATDHVKIYSTLDEVKKDFGDSPTSEEYEPDDGDPSGADRVQWHHLKLSLIFQSPILAITKLPSSNLVKLQQSMFELSHLHHRTHLKHTTIRVIINISHSR